MVMVGCGRPAGSRRDQDRPPVTT